jgi:hypothetical protein
LSWLHSRPRYVPDLNLDLDDEDREIVRQILTPADGVQRGA